MFWEEMKGEGEEVFQISIVLSFFSFSHLPLYYLFILLCIGGSFFSFVYFNASFHSIPFHSIGAWYMGRISFMHFPTISYDDVRPPLVYRFIVDEDGEIYIMSSWLMGLLIMFEWQSFSTLSKCTKIYLSRLYIPG